LAPRAVILFVDDLGYNEINTGKHAPPSGGYSGYGGQTQTPHVERCAASPRAAVTGPAGSGSPADWRR
jgi:hypothetical protein